MTAFGMRRPAAVRSRPSVMRRLTISFKSSNAARRRSSEARRYSYSRDATNHLSGLRRVSLRELVIPNISLLYVLKRLAAMNPLLRQLLNSRVLYPRRLRIGCLRGGYAVNDLQPAPPNSFSYVFQRSPIAVLRALNSFSQSDNGSLDIAPGRILRRFPGIL
jgi:hypothetical protein